jgi:hypothetical protein
MSHVGTEYLFTNYINNFEITNLSYLAVPKASNCKLKKGGKVDRSSRKLIGFPNVFRR